MSREIDRIKQSSARTFCQIARQEITAPICLETQGQEGCFGCAAPTRLCELCHKRLVDVPAVGMCSHCLAGQLILEKKLAKPVFKPLTRVECQIFKREISAQVCVVSQGQELCRNCPAPTRLCETCHIRPIHFRQYGQCLTCAVDEYAHDWTPATETDEPEEEEAEGDKTAKPPPNGRPNDTGSEALELTSGIVTIQGRCYRVTTRIKFPTRLAAYQDQATAARVSGASAETLPSSDPLPEPELETLPVLLTVSETASLLRITAKAVYALAERNKLPGIVHQGRKILFDSEALMAWLKQGGNKTVMEPKRVITPIAPEEMYALVKRAITVVRRRNRASINLIANELGVEFYRARQVLECLEALHVVSPRIGLQARTVLPPQDAKPLPGADELARLQRDVSKAKARKPTKAEAHLAVARQLVVQHRNASYEFLEERLGVSKRTVRIILDLLEAEGTVGPSLRGQERTVHVPSRPEADQHPPAPAKTTFGEKTRVLMGIMKFCDQTTVAPIVREIIADLAELKQLKAALRQLGKG